MFIFGKLKQLGMKLLGEEITMDLARRIIGRYFLNYCVVFTMFNVFEKITPTSPGGNLYLVSIWVALIGTAGQLIVRWDKKLNRINGERY